MSRQQKTSPKTAKLWQRHALSKACVLAIAGASVGSAAWAVDPSAALSVTYGTITPSAAQTTQGYYASPLSSSAYYSQWVNPQVGTADIMAPINSATYFSSLTGSGGSFPVDVSLNSVLSSVLANQATNSMTTLNRASATNDGNLSLNLQIFTGLVDTGTPAFGGNVSALAQLDNTSLTTGTVGIQQVGLASADLSVSNNSMGANAGFNSVTTTVTVATPSGYTSSSKGSSSLAFSATGSSMGNPATPTGGSTGSVNLSNLQAAFNAQGTAEVKGVDATIAVSGTTGSPGTAGILDKSIEIKSNSITATSNSNSVVSVFTSTAASAAFTGTVGVTNSQSLASGATAVDQYAGVTGSDVALDVRKGSSAISIVSGSVSVSDNTVSAQATGNTAGSQSATGSVLAGNAIVFEGSSNITGANTTRSTDLTASIGATSANAEADLLINNAQRVAGNNFTAEVVSPKVTSNVDDMSGNGSLTQSGNRLSATATNNLAGNLVSVGQSASVASLSGSTVVLNTQQTKTVTTLAKVTGGEVSAQIGYGDAVDGAATLNSNTLSATAQGNLAVSSVLLKADNLTVGANNGASSNVTLNTTNNSAVSGLAVSTLNAQTNDAQQLSALNTTGSVALLFENGSGAAQAISGTQGTVNSNQLLATATGNSASNRTDLQSTNAAGMNVAVGSIQTNTASTVAATSGASATPLSIALKAESTVDGSQLSLSSNSISAQAQLNSVSNSLTTTLTNTSGVGGMLTSATPPNAMVGSVVVTAQADFALANAQTSTGASSVDANAYGTMTLAAGAVGATTASTLVANSNRITAAAEGNSASNAMTLTNANMSGMTAALASGQSVSTTPIQSSTEGAIAVNTAAVGNTGKASSVSLNDNAVTASTVGNVVTNNLAVTATTASGRAVNTSSSSDTRAFANDGSTNFNGDFGLSNNQQLQQTGLPAASGNDIYSEVLGSVKVTTTGDVKGGSAITLDANNLTASSLGNSAGNTLNMGVGQLSLADMGLGSLQFASGADIKASNTASSVQLDASAANISQAAQLTVTDNTLQSTAVANTATNQVTLTGTNLTAPALTMAYNKGAVIGGTTAPVATSALANQQTSTSNTLTASVGTSSTPSSVQLLANAVSGASALTLSDNTLASVAYNNNAINGMTLSVTNATGATGALGSRQSVDTSSQGASLAETFGSVKLDAAGAVTGSLTVNGNSITADNVGNSATNQMAVTASQWDGRTVNTIVPSATVGTGLNTSVAADLALANQQNIVGKAVGTAVITATVDGTVENNFLSLTSGNITSNANTVSAAATGNNATNALTLSTNGLTGTTTGVGSLQAMDTGKISSAATTGTAGVGAVGGAVDGGNVSVNSNVVQAMTRANTVSNQVTLAGTNVTAPTPTLSNKGVVIGSNTAVVATSALANGQTSTKNTLVSSVGDATTSASVQLEAAAVSNASALTLSDNTLASVASNNNAINGMTLSVTNATGAIGALASRQSVDTSVSGSSLAETFGSVKLDATGAVTGTGTAKPNLTVNGNSIFADNVGNSATNRMAVTASQWDGRTTNTIVPNASVGSGLNTTAAADLALANQQNIVGAGATTGVITATVEGTVENNFASLTLGNITSNENTVSAIAMGNNATNALSLNTTGLTGTTTGVASLQVMNTGKISSAATTGTLDVGAKGGSVDDGNVSVNSNVVQAMTRANMANNSLSVTATNATGTTSAVAPTSSYDLTTLALVADTALVNNQATLSSNGVAEVGTSSAPARIKSDVGAVTLNTTASNLTLNSNSLTSAAYANQADNAVTVAANNASTMTAGLGNAQNLNAGSLQAKTYGTIDSQLASLDQSSATVNSNAITATASGNYAANNLGVSGSNATGRSVQSGFTRDDAVTQADLVLNNKQVFDNNTLTATTTGNVYLDSAGAVTGASAQRSNLSLNSNTVSAYGSSNYASNTLAVTPGNLTNATSALASSQTATRSSVDSVVTLANGSVQLQAAAVSDANLAMNSNTIKSTALDNVAMNQLSLTGTTVTGDATLAMTGISNVTSTPSVVADVSLTNLQTSIHDGVMKARTGYDATETASPVSVATEVAGATDASVSANGNTVSSLLYANNASNTLGMAVTTANAMSAALSNTQLLDPGVLSAYTRGDVLLTSTGAVGTANLSLNNNSITATAGANDAANKMTVGATNLVGRDMASRATVATLRSVNDFALFNEQSLESGSSVQAQATGDVHLNAVANTIGSSSLSVNGNTLSATGIANNASNELTLSATNSSQASVGLASGQNIDNSSVTSLTTGSIMVTGGVTTDSALTAAGNTIKSTALGNLATNTLTITASNFTGPTIAGPTSSTVAAEPMGVASDFAIANTQVNSSTLDIKAQTLGTVQMALGDVTGTSSAASSNSMTGNTITAVAQSNSATNAIKLTVTELRSAAAGVSSTQSSYAAVNAIVGPDTNSSSAGLFAVTTADVTQGSITVSGNTASALAGMNEAFNTLTVSGANLLARGLAVTAPMVSLPVSVGADFAVVNYQIANGSAESALNAGASGLTASGAFSAGSVSVNGNALLSQASANTANNTLTLAASNRLEASGVVNNVQEMGNGASVKAAIASTSALNVELGSTAGNAAVTVKDNTVTAQATGNVANNVLNASANNAMTSAGASGTPTFAVLNSQSTGNAPVSGYGVQSIINGISIGGAQLVGSLNGGSATVVGNQVLSVAYGNSVNNSVVTGTSTPALNTASASITSVQYNLTSVTATIGGTSVQASGNVGSTGVNMGITGNSMVAMAVGNRSVSTITGR